MNFIEEKIIKKDNFSNLKLRFPPENNGELHIGHAKAICLNFELAKKYDRPCNLRIDDTNPLVEKQIYTDSIINDVKWLGYEPSDITYTSNYFNFIYDCAVTLIKKGLAYVDDSTSEEIALMKGTTTLSGTSSKYSDTNFRSIQENLDLFNKMKLGEIKEGDKVLRAKIDMKSPNLLMRDPIIYRIIKTKHYKTGDKWKIYPMYDFAHPLSDYIEKITDSLCTLEFEPHRELYNWVLNNCDLSDDKPEQTEFSRLNINYNITSKRKLKTLIENKIVTGYDDPRLHTLKGLKRRGFTPDSIKNFCEEISVTKKDGITSFELLEEILRKELNKNSIRLMAVLDPIKIIITNTNKNIIDIVEIENNPEDINTSKRKVPFTKELYIERKDFNLNPDKKYNGLTLNGEVRLKGAYVIKAEDFTIDEKTGLIKEVFCTYDALSKSGMDINRKIKGTIHWLSVDNAIDIQVRNYENLFTIEQPNKNDNFINYINPNSLIINKNSFVESYFAYCNRDYPVQFIRNGYYIIDSESNDTQIIYNKTVSLKQSYK
jgi:glutaminyl-tRNA synthetase